jgi:membrane-associated protein
MTTITDDPVLAKVMISGRMGQGDSMDLFSQAMDLFLHLDRHLAEITRDYGTWTYAILFMIVFCETGLVVTPFLPGDSLLFAAGALAATDGSGLSLGLLCLVLIVAAVLGDSVNYQIGHFLGPKVLTRSDSRILKKEHLDRTHSFFEKYGGRTIIFARFVPIVRTFAPFIAGVGAMRYPPFILFNVVGGAAWVTGFVFAGFMFGNLDFVKEHFSMVILVIIVLSILPIVWELHSGRKAKPSKPPGP